MVEIYLNNEPFIDGDPFPLLPMKVDRNTDNDPNKPKGIEQTFRIENKTKNFLYDIAINTNLPKDSYSLYNLPSRIEAGQSPEFKLILYPRMMLDAETFPDSIYFEIKMEEGFEV